MKIYGTATWDPEYDEGYGGERENYEYYLHRSTAQAVCDEHNAVIRLEILRKYVREFIGVWNMYCRAKAEHEALVAARMRIGDFPGQFKPPYLYRIGEAAWGGQYPRGWWLVMEEIDVEER